LAVWASPAAAATIKVNCSSQDLQAKITAATPGSTLSVEGRCSGNFTIDKDLTLQGSTTATLDG